jgi:transcriptional regulator with XRE-family HTH domain
MPKRGQNYSEEYSAYERSIAQAMGERIRHRRQQLGLLQEDVRMRLSLEKVYMSRTQYSRIETGESLLRASEIVALMRILDCSCAWLLFGEASSSIDGG